jgi:hypothetical protein
MFGHPWAEMASHYLECCLRHSTTLISAPISHSVLHLSSLVLCSACRFLSMRIYLIVCSPFLRWDINKLKSIGRAQLWALGRGGAVLTDTRDGEGGHRWETQQNWTASSL